jgi:hypothetical protein
MTALYNNKLIFSKKKKKKKHTKRSHLPYMIIHIPINNTKKNHLLQQWLPYKKQWLSPQK